MLSWVVCSAQDKVDYGIMVAGVAVTSYNASNVTSSDIIQGKVYYNATENTLYLDNATIKVNTSYQLKHGIKCSRNVTIKVVGSSKIEADSPNIYCIQVVEGFNVKLTGASGSQLTVSAPYSKALYMGINSTLTLQGSITVKATGINAVSGYDGNTEKLKLEGLSSLTAKGSSGSVVNVKEVEAIIVSPTDAVFRTNAHYIATQSNMYEPTTKEVIMSAPESFDFKVADVEVNTYNYTNIKSSLIQGTVSYSPSSKTLRLTDATINVSGAVGINNYSQDNLNIMLIGTNKIIGTNGTGIISNADLCIHGFKLNEGGSLDISGVEQGIVMSSTSGSSSTLTLGKEGADTYETVRGNAPTIKINSSKAGIRSINAAVKNSIKIYGVRLTATVGTASEYTPISNFESVDLGDYCDITTPNGAYYDENTHEVAVASGSKPSTIVIEPVTKYPLIVGRGHVNDRNRNDIKSGVKSGVVTYDGAYTLTLANAVIEGNIMALPDLKALRIHLKGTNVITGELWTIIAGSCDLTIVGESSGSTLKIYSNATSIAMVNADENSSKKLYIHDCIVQTFNSSSICGSTSGKGTELLVENAEINISKSTDEGSSYTPCPIADFNKVTLDGCYYVTPYGAYYDTESKQLINAENGAPVNGRNSICWIRPGKSYNIAINGIGLTSANIDNLDKTLKNTYGTYTYDANAQKLIIDDITQPGTYGIEIYDDATIEAVGQNDFYSNAPGLSIYRGNLTLQGDGITTFDSTSDGCWMRDNTSLNIRNTTARFYSSDEGGITGSDSKTAKLTIYNSDVKANGNGTVATISGLASMNLQYCEMVKPSDINYNLMYYPDLGYVGYPNVYGTAYKYTKEIVIKPTGLRGDINRDGSVNTTDVTALYNVIFGTDTTTDKGICNLDGKAEVNTTDVTELYNIIFGTAK